MADPKDSDGSAEKAYAAAASEIKADKTPAKAEAKPVAEEPAPAKVEEPAPAPAPAEVAKAEPAKAPAAKAAPKPAAKKPAPKKPVAAKAKPAPKPAAAPKSAAKKTVAKRKPAMVKKPTAPARAKSPAKPVAISASTGATPSVTELKEKIMATKTTDFTAMMSKSMSDAVSEMQMKAQEAYDKGTSMVSDMTEAAKGNVEAMVESGKIMAAGMQDMGKSYADEAKSAYETMTADLKEMAAVKSPTELFQLQGKIMRRNFDAMVATSSKGAESAMKLANDAFAPISARVNLAVEKMSKAA